ncbi:hypothetical protein ACE1BV_22110 [Aeromonas hydrophila]|uniref:hypothetical protein n=1 Tax=Aeromonas hydrophila TaxID=644 RepID=UPI0035BA84AA
MKHLSDYLIDYNNDLWLDLACKSAKINAKGLTLIKDKIKIEYSKYNLTVKGYNVCPPESKFIKNKDVIVDFYESPPITYKSSLQKRRNEHDLEECPYCGQPIKPNTLDHFFPKDFWPEFSILQNNLIPQCTTCAPIKGANYYCDITNISKFINPIYSDILSQIEFNIEINFNPKNKKITTTIKLESLRNLTKDENERLKNHFKHLRIIDRLNEYCKKEYYWICRTLKKMPMDVNKLIQSKIDLKHEVKKDWESAFYFAIKDNKALILYFKNISAKFKAYKITKKKYPVSL